MKFNTSFIRAVKWSYAGNWGERGVSTILTFILAAILGPKDFGVVAIGMVYITFLQLFLDQGFMAALIQKKDLEKEHLDAVFWMDLVLSLLLTGASILLSGWWAAKNHAPEIAGFISVLSLCIPIRALSAVQSAILNRKMDFRSLSIRANAAVIASGVVGIGLAFAGFRVWALVAQQITRDFIAALLLWRLSPWRPQLTFSWAHLKDLTGFSTSNFVAQLAVFADMQSTSILLGLLFGPVAVGLYRLADRLVNTVVSIATSSIQSVSLPEFARVQDRPEELRHSVITCIWLSSTMTFPALSGLAAVSWAMMATLGPKWVPASTALQILCLVGISIVFATFTAPLLQAMALPRYLAGLEWVRTVVGGVIVIAAGLTVRNSSVSLQLMGVAIARFVTMTCLVAPAFLYILVRLAGISWGELRSAVAPSVIASLSLVAAILLLRLSGLETGGRPWVALSAECSVGGVVGMTTLLFLDAQLRGAVVSLWNKARQSSLIAHN